MNKKNITITDTLDYYNAHAETFSAGTFTVDFKVNQDVFLQYMPAGAFILDFGCGSGRDAKYFTQLGYAVDATDGSVELCKIATAQTGIPVRHMLFQELNETEKYDGIWACSSILHLPKEELKPVLVRMIDATKQDGYIYTSFKYGNFEGERNGRYFTDFTEEDFVGFIEDLENIAVEKTWITGDVRPGREEEQWLNIILKKMTF